ncbi:MAG: hypothetical protein ABWX67_12410 [Allosphingosinicella sp.]
MSARRALLAALCAAAAGPALAAPGTPMTAERAAEIQQDQVREAVGTAPCRRDRETGDIVVCGRRGPDPNRLPFPVERLPGEPENLLPGELARAQTSYDTCVIGCRRGPGIDAFKAVTTTIKIVRHVLGKDD